jgi:large subunit ribosomal protein L21
MHNEYFTLTIEFEKLIFNIFQKMRLIKDRLRRAKSMYAVVATGGKQYKVQEGEVLRVEKLDGEIGKAVSFDQVLMVSNGETVQVGFPVLERVAVRGHIVEQGKAKKVLVFKYKRRKRYRRMRGHRQQFTAIQIDQIEASPAGDLSNN